MRDPASELLDAAALVRERAALQEVATLKREVKALADRLVEAQQQFGVLAQLDGERRPLRPLLTKPPRVKARNSGRVATAVALVSDLHVEERIDPKTVGGLNEYTPAIAERRIERLFQGIEWLVATRQRDFQIQDLLLWLGGDIITGYIHEELLEGNFLSPTEATLFAQRVLSDGIRYLLKTTKLNVNVCCSYGNHGRTTPRKRVATAAANSFEWLLYQVLAKEFGSEKRVQFQIADGSHMLVDVGEYRIHFHHGDDIRYGGGIGGMDVPINRAVAQWHATMPAHTTCIGHFHCYQAGERVHRNGSGIGYGPYARDIVRAPYEAPRQAFFLVDQKRGKTFCAPIWLDK